MRLDLLQPVLYVVKGGLLRAIVHQNDSHCALVVCLSNRSEAFLSRRIPYLQLDALILHIDRLDLKVNAC